MTKKGTVPPPLAQQSLASFGGTGPFSAVSATRSAWVESFCALFVGIAIVAAWSGGWRVELFGVTISVRSIWRPLLVAAVLLAAHAVRAREFRLTGFADTTARAIAGALLVAGVLGWTTYLSPYLGGADSYGYVSASERLSAGALVQTEPLAAILPYPEATSAATPLGYVPAARVPNATAPAYPLGLPALMALAAMMFGASAPFYVSLVMGVVLAGTCYWIALRITGLPRPFDKLRVAPSGVEGRASERESRDDRLIALAAAAAVSLHPVVFAYAIQAMSDVPATAWYLVAGALLMPKRRWLAGLAGVAGCAAFLTRPALLPGVAALALIPLVSGDHRRSRIAAFAGVLTLGVAMQAALQWYLYGSPLANGYGRTDELFSFRFLGPNVRSYAYWIAVMHGVVWIVAFARGVYDVRDRSARAMLAASFAGAVVPHVVYRTYDHWETLRFILPLLVVMTIFAVAGVFGLSRRIAGSRAGIWVGLALTVVMVAGWARWLDREQVFSLARVEQRFEQAAALVARATPRDAVILSSLHSGSLRYYADRQTLNWARIPHGQFDVTVDTLENHGRAVFLMFDGQEERQLFEERHGDVIGQQRWLPSGQRRDVRLYEYVERAGRRPAP